jgi:hypothetical protein
MSNEMFEPGDDANRMAMEFACRLARLTSVSAISAIYKRVDTCLLYLKRSFEGLEKSQQTGSMEDLVDNYWRTVRECTDKYVEDFRNDIQVVSLTQEESRVWISRIDQARQAPERQCRNSVRLAA